MHGTLCPRFHKAIELIGSRWTGAVLRLLMGGPARFAQLRDSIPEISDRMLSERLRILEEEGLIERRVLPEPPIRVEYELTQMGKELNRSLEAIGHWAEKWLQVEVSGLEGKQGKPGNQVSATRVSEKRVNAPRVNAPRVSESRVSESRVSENRANENRANENRVGEKPGRR